MIARLMRIFTAMLLLSLIIPPAVSSVPITLDWQPVTTCVDGSAVGTAGCPAIIQYMVYCAPAASGVAEAIPVDMGTALSRSWEVSTTQTIYCGVTAANSACESAMSNIAVKAVTVPVAPQAPGCSFQ